MNVPAMEAPVVGAEELLEKIDRIPRKRIAVLPTGVQDLPRLGAEAGIEEFLVKRDDLTGIALGGNKSRAMEFVLADALASGCDTLVAGGGGEQSNHAVQCVASANRVGLDTVMVLQRRPDARGNGNALLHEVLGGRTVWIDSDPELRDRQSARSAMASVASELRAAGRKPYVLESSLHPLSIVAYVAAVVELADQLSARPRRSTRLYATSEGAVLGGLLLGTRLLGLPWEVIGLDWRPPQSGTSAHLQEMIAAAADALNVPNPVVEADIVIRPSGGPAYGVGNPDSWAALAAAARLEGLILDPVYTAKGMAGALDDLRRRPPKKVERVVFVHTGGVAAVFAYEAEMRRHVIAKDRTTDGASARAACLTMSEAKGESEGRRP